MVEVSRSIRRANADDFVSVEMVARAAVGNQFLGELNERMDNCMYRSPMRLRTPTLRTIVVRCFLAVCGRMADGAAIVLFGRPLTNIVRTF